MKSDSLSQQAKAIHSQSLDDVLYELEMGTSSLYIFDEVFSSQDRIFYPSYSMHNDYYLPKNHSLRRLIDSQQNELGYYTYKFNKFDVSFVDFVEIHPEYRNQHYGSILSLMVRKELADIGAQYIGSYIVEPKVVQLLNKWGLSSFQTLGYIEQKVNLAFQNQLDFALSHYILNLHPYFYNHN